MEKIAQRPCSLELECHFSLPSDLFDGDDVLLDSGYSTAVNTPDTEISAGLDASSLADLLKSFAVGGENWRNLVLTSANYLENFVEHDCTFWMNGRIMELADLRMLDCFVEGPSGYKYPVHFQLTEDSLQISCTFRPLECGQHKAFLFIQDQIQSSLLITVSRNYSLVRSRPAVTLDIEINASNGELEVRKPWGVACNIKTEQLAIADREKNEVLVYGPDGEFKFRFGSFGTGPGEFHRPIALTYDCAGDRLLVADKDNHRIQIFTSSGVFVSSFGTRGRREGQFNFPWGIAVSKDGQLIAVADSRNARIQFFDSNGRFIRQHRGQLKYPRGVAFDQTGENVFVSDFNLHSIFKVNVFTGSCLLLVDDTLLRRPSGLDVDIAGNIVLCDTRNHSIKIFDPTTGQLLHDVGSIGSNPFDLPLDITVMRAGLLATLDLNGRVRIF